MSTQPNVATIAAIAARAGVGTATVDRVLNGRPGVNAETMQRVLQVVSELGSPPLRGRPRLAANFRFVFVLPADPSPFIELIERQIAQAAGDFRHQHITEITQRFETADPEQFAAQVAGLTDCEGVALMAPDLPAVKLAINELVRAGVHVVTLCSDVAGSMRETHIGADNRAAGRTAGLLLGRMAGAAGRDTLLLSSQATRLSAEIDRRIGFAQVLEERFPRLKLLRTPDLPADDDGAQRALQAAGLADSVAAVAHDFTDAHRSLLGSGALSYVLHQDLHYCVLTAARVLRALCENVRGALSVVQPRIEILTAENLY